MTIPKIDLDNSIYTADIMFPDSLCEEVVEIFEHKENQLINTRFHHNNIAGGIDRKDEAIFLDDKEMDLYMDAGAGDLVRDVNDHLNIALQEYTNIFSALNGLPLRSARQKLQKTKKSGGYHVWHFEQTNLDSAPRVLAWTIYLNNVEEGGETEFLYQSKRVKAQKGKICLFPASFTHLHRGNPPLTGDKFILTGWFCLYQ